MYFELPYIVCVCWNWLLWSGYSECVLIYRWIYIYARNSMRNTLEQTELIYWRAWLKWGRGVCEPKVSIAIFGFLPICNQILFINCVSKDLISQRRKIFPNCVCLLWCTMYASRVSYQNIQTKHANWMGAHTSTHIIGVGVIFSPRWSKNRRSCQHFVYFPGIENSN